MTTATVDAPVAQPRRKQILPNGVLGTLIFVMTEVMFFAGMISTFMITKASVLGGVWPPPGQPRLPVAETAVNTAFLITSGVVIWWAGRVLADNKAKQARLLLLVGSILGIVFVAFQGVEWAGLLSVGLTMTSSNHGAFFYLIVGTHALHAIAAIAALLYVWARFDKLGPNGFWAARVFWYFVVAVWPILYWKVYL